MSAFDTELPTTMAYTLERARLACQLFSKYSHQEKAENFAKPYYQLRDRKDSKPIVTWIDDEEDGDYDPEEDCVPAKRKSQPGSSRMAPVAKRAKSHSPTPDLTSSPSSGSFNLSVHTPPTSSSDTDSDVDPWDTYWAIEASTDDQSTPYQLRTRKKPTYTEKEKIAQSPHNAITEPRSDNEEFTTEGCLACQELELSCSSIDDPYSYPCQTCRHDGLDCELLPAPKLKRACERCRHGRRGGLCSYLSADYNHSLPCQECLEHGFQCLAGPAKHNSETGASTDSEADTGIDTGTDTDTEADTNIESAGEPSGDESDDSSVFEASGYSSASDSDWDC